MSEKPHPFLSFCRTALLGGLAVVLPIAIVSFSLNWLYRAGSGLVRPLTELVLAQSRLQVALADLLVLLVLLLACFALGVLVRTQLGRWVHRQLEERLLAWVPGYKLVKETVGQFIGHDKSSPFQGVCQVRPFGGETWMTALLTAQHDDGRMTVYVPNAPLPTTGVIYHLPAEDVRLLPGVSVEQAMRTIMACGAGSVGLFEGVVSR